MQNKQKMSFKDLKKALKTEVNSPNKFGNDGEDHINISVNGATQLGKVLAPEYIKTFYYPHAGKFASVMSLWFWVRSQDFDDNLRNLTGVRLRNYVQANNAYGEYTPNFKAIIAYATWLKVKKYPDLLRQLKELNTEEVKFLSYRTIKDSGLRLSTKYSDLIISIANEISKALKEGREPNFDFLCDSQDKKGLNYLEGAFGRIMSKEKLEEMKNKKAEEAEKEEETEEVTEE